MRLATILSAITMLLVVCDASMGLIGSDYTQLASTQYMAGNTSAHFNFTDSYADIMNTSGDASPKILPGDYESTKYSIPTGPYTISFELRSPLNYFGVMYRTFNESKGSGKEYYTAQYEYYTMRAGYDDQAVFVDETIYSNGTTVKNAPDRIESITPYWLDTYIIHYIGPKKYPAAEPVDFIYDDILDVPKSWDTGYVDSQDVKIGGKNGREVYQNKVSKSGKTLAYHYEYHYNLDSETFVVIRTWGDWDKPKDLDLFKETLHITQK
jgi:hypothetical protein